MKKNIAISLTISLIIALAFYYAIQYYSTIDALRISEQKSTDYEKEIKFRTDNYGTLQKARERSDYIDKLRIERQDAQNKDIFIRDNINKLKEENTKDIEAISGFKIYFSE